MARRNGPQTEQERHKRAFEHYHAQGLGRSHHRTANDLGVSLAAVKAWSRAFGWRERIAEREAESTRQLADRTFASSAVESDRNLKIVHLGLLTLAKSIREGKIKGQMADVDRLIRLEEHLLGGDGTLCRDPDHVGIRQLRAMTELQRRDYILACVVELARRDPELRDGILKEVNALAGKQAGAGTPPEGV